MQVNYICSVCGKGYEVTANAFRCDCGGLFDLAADSLNFKDSDILNGNWSLFRYLRALPFEAGFSRWRDISMGEGLTPIVPLEKDRLNILVKVDYLMPTLSFKDRGAAVLIAKAKELGVETVIQDSSGNAGCSIAAYAKRAGIECHIYIPEGAEKKIKQILAHGAKVHVVKGSREDAADEALRAVEGGGGFYASHVYNPFFYQGTKTYAYEIYEQLGGDIPEALVVPAGNGTLLLGVHYGFRELKHMGLIKNLPRIIAVQAEGCRPLYNAFKAGKNTVEEVINTGTLAEGIAIARPMRGKQMLAAVLETGGEIITAPEDKIMEAQKYLAGKGFYVEPTTAATFAGFFNYCREGKYEKGARYLLPLCGAGLKSD